jgi:hypothetical protein
MTCTPKRMRSQWRKLGNDRAIAITQAQVPSPRDEPTRQFSTIMTARCTTPTILKPGGLADVSTPARSPDLRVSSFCRRAFRYP